MPVVSHDLKCYIVLYDHLDLRNRLKKLSASHDADYQCNGITWHKPPISVAPCDASVHVNSITEWEKSCCTSFKLSCLRNAMVPIFYATDIMWCQHHCKCCTLLSWLSKYSGDVVDATCITWCWCWPQWHHTWPEKSCCISFWSFWPKKWNDAIDDTVSSMWHWHQHQCHHMTKKVRLHIFQLSKPNEYSGAIDNATDIM